MLVKQYTSSNSKMSRLLIVVFGYLLVFVLYVQEIHGNSLVDEIHLKTSGYGSDIYADPTIIESSVSLIPYGIAPTKEKSIVIEVKTCSDAFIYLSESINLDRYAALYELVLGGASGTGFFLRKKAPYWQQIADIRVSNMVQCDKFSQFWINWDDNYLAVGTGNQLNTSILYSMESQLSVKGLGIRSFRGYNAHWIILSDAKGLFCVTHDRLCSSTAVYRTEVIRELACALMCSGTRSCMGFNYQTTSTTCHLMRAGETTGCQDAQDWHFAVKCWRETCLACL